MPGSFSFGTIDKTGLWRKEFFGDDVAGFTFAGGVLDIVHGYIKEGKFNQAKKLLITDESIKMMSSTKAITPIFEDFSKHLKGAKGITGLIQGGLAGAIEVLGDEEAFGQLMGFWFNDMLLKRVKRKVDAIDPKDPNSVRAGAAAVMMEKMVFTHIIAPIMGAIADAFQGWIGGGEKKSTLEKKAVNHLGIQTLQNGQKRVGIILDAFDQGKMSLSDIEKAINGIPEIEVSQVVKNLTGKNYTFNDNDFRGKNILEELKSEIYKAGIKQDFIELKTDDMQAIVNDLRVHDFGKYDIKDINISPDRLEEGLQALGFDADGKRPGAPDVPGPGGF